MCVCMAMLRGGGEKTKSPNMLLPWGDHCCVWSGKAVLGYGSFEQVEKEEEKGKERWKKKGGLSEDVRRRKHNRNINRKGLRSGSCYIWRWLCVLGLEGRLICAAIVITISRGGESLKTKTAWGMCGALQYLNNSISWHRSWVRWSLWKYEARWGGAKRGQSAQRVAECLTYLLNCQNKKSKTRTDHIFYVINLILQVKWRPV